MDYTFPIPKPDLISRFSDIFSRLKNHQSATLLALPYTGRTSLLRFISSNTTVQKELGLDPKIHQLVWLELDRTDYSYSQFLKELSISLLPDTIPSGDDYLTSLLIHQTISHQTQNQHLILVITLNWKTIPSLPDIDRFLALLQKSATFHNLTYLFSIDTTVYRSLISIHPSSTILEKIFYFPTFTKKETLHSLKRIYLSKNLPPNKKLLNQAFHLSGGIAGFFHSLVNLGPDFINHPSQSEFVTRLKSEISLFPDLANPAAKNLVMTTKTQISLGEIKLNHQPTAQEINLIKLLQNKLNTPVSRDEIAACLWGNLSATKYSDWAIDKAISRLRKLIISQRYLLITVKNLGYQLTSL